MAALNWPALWLVWLVWPVDDELAGAVDDEVLEELPPQPDTSTSIAAATALSATHDLGLA